MTDSLHKSYPTVTLHDREVLARSLALTAAVDRQVDWMVQVGWGEHLYYAIPAGNAPWQGQCLALDRAAHSHPTRVWMDDTKQFAAFYLSQGFWENEAAKMVGSDKLLYRSVAEEMYLRDRLEFPANASNLCPDEVANILLRGMLLQPNF